MPKRFGSRTEKTRDDWQTPNYIVEALGKFDLDPCANEAHPARLATRGLTIKDDGLTTPWRGRVFMNPPYGTACRVWLKRLAEHGDGIALVPPRMGSDWFHEVVLSTFGAIYFLRKRISFLGDDMKPVPGSDTDSILIAYGGANVEALKNCALRGRIWVNTEAVRDVTEEK